MKNLKEYESVVEILFLEKKKLLDKICQTCYVGMGSVGKVWEKGGKIFLWKHIAYLVVTHQT
jgi:hypothetical protein